jgi:hypothetical protein
VARTIVVRKAVAVTFALAGLAGAFIAGTGAAADATQGQAVIAGQDNSATNATTLTNTSGAHGLIATASFGVGVYGSAETGLAGLGTAVGVEGSSYGNNAGNGVEGHTVSSLASGVYGENTNTGFGVAGRAANGTGVLADSANGTALNVQGTLVLSRSGRTTVFAGQNFKQITLTHLESNTFIVATVQGATADVWVQRVVVNTAGGYFRIYLNTTAAASTKVGWFAVN